MKESPSQRASKSWCRELLLGHDSHTPYLTPRSKAGSRASKIKYPQSLLELAPATLAAGEGDRTARPGCKVINAIWFKASTLRSPRKPRKMPASESTLLHLTPEWDCPTQLCRPTDLLGSLEWDGQWRCQRHRPQRHAEQVTLYQNC